LPQQPEQTPGDAPAGPVPTGTRPRPPAHRSAGGRPLITFRVMVRAHPRHRFSLPSRGVTPCGRAYRTRSWRPQDRLVPAAPPCRSSRAAPRAERAGFIRPGIGQGSPTPNGSSSTKPSPRPAAGSNGERDQRHIDHRADPQVSRAQDRGRDRAHLTIVARPHTYTATRRHTLSRNRKVLSLAEAERRGVVMTLVPSSCEWDGCDRQTLRRRRGFRPTRGSCEPRDTW
jgi:hypothetical protein